MARYSTPKSGGTSKFRMVVIDAELQEGEISQLAQAIQGAFGGQRLPTARFNGAGTRSLSGPDPMEASAELDGADVVDEIEVPPAAPVPTRSKAPKKTRTPNLDPDLNPGADPPFKVYAEARNVTAQASVLSKFLVVAAWLHDERSEMKITAERAYTCFRFIEWPVNVDFYQPLRDMTSKSKFLELKPEDKGTGEYSTTLLGRDKASKMKVAA